MNHPAFDKSSGLNQVLAKAAAENGVAIGLTLRPLLNSRGSRRIRLLSDLRANLDLARKYEVSLVLSSDAMSCFDLRSPMEALALAEICGLEEDEAIDAMSTVPEKIISRNRPGPDISGRVWKCLRRWITFETPASFASNEKTLSGL